MALSLKVFHCKDSAIQKAVRFPRLNAIKKVVHFNSKYRMYSIVQCMFTRTKHQIQRNGFTS